MSFYVIENRGTYYVEPGLYTANVMLAHRFYTYGLALNQCRHGEVVIPISIDEVEDE